jgi:hypothetical protein
LSATPKVPSNEPITWGNATASVFQLQASSQAEVPPAKFEESQRKYDVVRVYNPDDREQFVDTEQMTEYQGRNSIGKERTTIRFSGNSNTENTEVIQKGIIRKSSS